MAVVESSPLVGSSRNNTPGDTISSIPMAVRFLCPPDTPRVNGVPIYQNSKQKYICMYAHTHRQILTWIHTHIHTYIYCIPTHTHARTRTHTHTRTYIQMPLCDLKKGVLCIQFCNFRTSHVVQLFM